MKAEVNFMKILKLCKHKAQINDYSLFDLQRMQAVVINLINKCQKLTLNKKMKKYIEAKISILTEIKEKNKSK